MAQILYSGMGGHGSVAFSLLGADQNREWRPFLGFLGIEPLSGAYAEQCRTRGISHRYFPVVAGKSWRAWGAIFAWLSDIGPEAIILHSITALLPCLIYSRSRNAPLIVVEHQSNALKSRSEWAFSFLAMLLADRIVTLTPDYDRELRRWLGPFFRPEKVRIIPNGVDVSRFSPGNGSDRRTGSIRLGMAARFTEIRRQDALIDMLSELRRREPGVDWRLSLAGDGVTREALERRAQGLGLGACVNFPGQLNEEEMIAWYSALDIYLHASEGETLSTSLLQAMASGLPIIASDAPGIGNLVAGETDCGVLVQGQSPQGFAAAVIGLVERPEAVVRLGANGRRLAEEFYSHRQMFSKYKCVIENKASGSEAGDDRPVSSDGA
ncbi:glycosyltransferase family 4 protein [Methylocystis heyeri]|uniref:glycosyltransferase family 4 protein n=1 Tax=Methylocystis heyeri TaxID=391905 RepID=UPI001FE39C88|nr:glycosyltransferase family 4 protein [Methylocystis heyeri]